MAEPEFTPSEYPAAVAKALGEVDSLRASVLGMVASAQTAEDAARIFPDLPATICLGYQSGSLHGVLLHVGSFGLDGIVKDVRTVFPLLKELSRRGYQRVGEPEDYAEIGRRTWTLQKFGEKTPILVSVFLATPGLVAGQVCRFEQIGVEEKPVFKLVCEPEATP